MKNSKNPLLWKILFRIHPAYRGTGGRVTYIAADWSEVHVKIPLNLATRNYVGTIFGGSIYGGVDPIYMIMLIKRLGKGFIVWDKESNIKFLKPGRSALKSIFLIPDEEIEFIKKRLHTEHSINRIYLVELFDQEGNLCAQVEKTIYIRRK
ncbi:PaaI family thioesterase [Chloroflexota bacterium]